MEKLCSIKTKIRAWVNQNNTVAISNKIRDMYMHTYIFHTEHEFEQLVQCLFLNHMKKSPLLYGMLLLPWRSLEMLMNMLSDHWGDYPYIWHSCLNWGIMNSACCSSSWCALSHVPPRGFLHSQEGCTSLSLWRFSLCVSAIVRPNKKYSHDVKWSFCIGGNRTWYDIHVLF